MLIVTINEIPGKKLEALGVVRGSTVQSRNFGHDLMAGFRTLGADAIVGMRYASASVMQGAAEVIAYGTAVKFV